MNWGHPPLICVYSASSTNCWWGNCFIGFNLFAWGTAHQIWFNNFLRSYHSACSKTSCIFIFRHPVSETRGRGGREKRGGCKNVRISPSLWPPLHFIRFSVIAILELRPFSSSYEKHQKNLPAVNSWIIFAARKSSLGRRSEGKGSLERVQGWERASAVCILYPGRIQTVEPIGGDSSQGACLSVVDLIERIY